MKIPLKLGTLSITGDVFTSITGYAATHCFGVKGMASRNLQSGIVQLLRRDSLAKGVCVTCPENGDSLDIELHIVIEHGVNIPALCRSIVSEVRYHVEKMTGIKVGHVAVCIDSIVSS